MGSHEIDATPCLASYPPRRRCQRARVMWAQWRERRYAEGRPHRADDAPGFWRPGPDIMLDMSETPRYPKTGGRSMARTRHCRSAVVGAIYLFQAYRAFASTPKGLADHIEKPAPGPHSGGQRDRDQRDRGAWIIGI